MLTENYAALRLLQQKLPYMEDAVIIFGSSFPNDQEYTEVSVMGGSFVQLKLYES